GKLSFASVLVLPISSALFYPPNPEATSTLSLPTSNRTTPYIFPYFPSLLQVKKKSESDLFLKVTAKKTGRPTTPSEFFSDLITPPLFPAINQFN
ncbi:hypothetical protein Gotur_006950, partial [Gossypium turneri]